VCSREINMKLSFYLYSWSLSYKRLLDIYISTVVLSESFISLRSFIYVQYTIIDFIIESFPAQDFSCYSALSCPSLFNSTLLFNDCSIIVQLFFDHCSVFRSWKCIPGILVPLSTTSTESINIIQVLYKAHLLSY
jgi:hypothetical protein